MHGHGSTRAERVCSDVFWGEAKSGRSHLQALGSDDGNGIGCADGAEAMIRGIIADGGGGITHLVVQAQEDVDAHLDWAGCGGLRTEVGDGLAVDGILLIVEGGDNLSGLAKMLGGSVPGEKEGGELEVGVGDRTLRVGRRYQTSDNVWGARMSPYQILNRPSRVETHASRS